MLDFFRRVFLRCAALWCILGAFSSYAEDSNVLARLQSYLSSLRSVVIDFTQEDTRGVKASGAIIIAKPDRFLCNYYPPYPIIIVGNKSYVSIYDFDLEQLSHIKTTENMFNFLLTDSGKIEDNFEILGVMQSDELLEVDLYNQELERITKVFIKLPEYLLRSIEMQETDGNRINIDIHSIANISNIDNSIFIIRNPEIYGPLKRMTKEELQQKYKICS